MSSCYDDEYVTRTYEYVGEKINLFAEKVKAVCEHIHMVLEDKRLEREAKRLEKEEAKKAELEHRKELIRQYKEFIQSNVAWVDKTIEKKYQENQHLIQNADIKKLQMQVKSIHSIGSYPQELLEDIQTLQETDIKRLTRPQLEEFKAKLLSVKDKIAYYDERNKAIVLALLDKEYTPDSEVISEEMLLQANKKFVEVFTVFDGLLGCKKDVGDGITVFTHSAVEQNKTKTETKQQSIQVRKN